LKIVISPSFIITLLSLFLTSEVKFVLMMLFSAFVHEVGHIVTLKLFRVRIKSLELGLFGGTINLERKLISYKKEIAVSLSGSFVNLIFALIFFFILRQGFDTDIFFLFLSNLFYALFNLLPITNLDGGNALLSLLSMKKELYDAEKQASIISKITLFLLALGGVNLVLISGFNVSLFIIVLLLYAESSENHIISGYKFCRKTS